MASAADQQFWHDNIANTFKSYGYDATPEEIAALVPASEGKGGYEAGQAAVANYVLAHQQISGAKSLIEGQLKAEQAAGTAAQSMGASDQAAGTSSYQQAQQTLQEAPKLFGSLTPDQIGTYLAPLQNQFNYGLGQVQGTAAQRGLAGSSLEAQAMAQAQTQFQQNVLSQGLSIGQQQQQLLASQQAALGAQQFGASGQQYGLAGQYAGLANQSAGQNFSAAEDLAQLSGQSANQAIAQNATLQALNPSGGNGGWQNALGSGLGAVAGGVAGAYMGNPMLGASLGASLGGAAANGITGGYGTTGNTLSSGLGMASLFNRTPTGAIQQQSQPIYNVQPTNGLVSSGGDGFLSVV